MSFLSVVMSMYVVIGVHSHDNRRLTWRNTVYVSCTSTSHYQLTRWYVGVLWEWVTCGEWSLELGNEQTDRQTHYCTLAVHAR